MKNARGNAMGMVMAIPNPRSGFARSENPNEGEAAGRLEQLRAILLRALDDLESQTRQRLREVASPPDDAEVDRRLKELEAAQTQFRAEVDRWEHNRADQIEALDQDRRELAEVWQRIERLEIRGQAPTTTTPQNPATTPVAGYPRAYPRPSSIGPGSSLPPVPRTPASSNTTDSPVTRAVLEQFQVLRRDVRRKADGRSSG